MRQQLFAAAMVCTVYGAIGTASVLLAAPNGNPYGHWAGRLCDRAEPGTNGLTYWESRDYADRSQCVKLETQSLQRGAWATAD